jgi:hypothetical protein
MRQGDSAPADPAAAVKCDLAGEVLRTFGSLRFAATGWSMLPTIWPGDMLVVERVGCDEVGIGNVVLVGRDGRLCAHRVVSRAASGSTHGATCLTTRFITQGDAMPAPDRPVTESELLGRVDHLIRAGKRIEVRTKLSVVERVIAKIIRRSFFAARALVYLHRIVNLFRIVLVRTSENSDPRESVLPCQG